MTSDSSGTPSTKTFTFDDADRITADSASGTYAADASGRVAARPSRQFVWDSLGRLTTVKDAGGNVISSYAYDPLDRLRTSTISGTTRRYRYVGLSAAIAQVWDETAGEVERNLATDLAERPVGGFTTSASNPVSWLLNAHHDVVGATNASGAVARWYRYDPDGAIVAQGGSGLYSIQRWQGSWYDTAAGLYWVVSRWYDPVTARFLSEDSLLGEPRNPDSRHLYAYGEGDPVNGWDPEGRQGTPVTCTLGGGPFLALFTCGSQAVWVAAGVAASVAGAVLASSALFASIGTRSSISINVRTRSNVRKRVQFRANHGGFVIGESQPRVEYYARVHLRKLPCHTMPSLPDLSSGSRMRLNRIWINFQMAARNLMHDLGTCYNSPAVTSNYYRMERETTRWYSPRLERPGWEGPLPSLKCPPRGPRFRR